MFKAAACRLKALSEAHTRKWDGARDGQIFQAIKDILDHLERVVFRLGIHVMSA
jgi:hypothetical protein